MFSPSETQRQSQGGYGGSSMGPGRSYHMGGNVGGPGGDGSSWSMQNMQGNNGHGGRQSSMPEGQQFITITPSVGEEIHVPVDIHQASKQADEKRLRNAGASARFRARKKEKDREVQLGMQRLEAHNRDLLKRIHELEMRCEFYRSDRNRLRQAILQNPSMREQVDLGPPSPASTAMSGGSFVPEGSPMPSGPMQPGQYGNPMQQSAQSVQPHPSLQHMAPHAQQPSLPPMSTAPSMSGPPGLGPLGPEGPYGGERPARRRRTDSGPGSEFHPTSAYSSPMPTTLPPLPPTGFHSLTPSPLTGSPNDPNPRLPPLRLDTGGSVGSNAGAMGGGGSAGGYVSASPTPEPMLGASIPPPVGAYPPMTTGPASAPMYSRTYETAGWATETPSPHMSHPYDHHQR